MKIQIPDALKADMPQNLWGRVLSSTPIVMTVIATMLAGLASSEMTRAQYDRAMAAQLQSKSGDQWGFFQAKKLRGALQGTALDMMVATMAVPAFDAAALQRAGEAQGGALKTLLESDAGRAALGYLARGEVPAGAPDVAPDAKILAVQQAIEEMQPPAEIAGRLSEVSDAQLEAALHAARDQTVALDAATKPVSQAVEKIERELEHVAAPDLRRSFVVARLRLDRARYDAEARLNQRIGGLYELQVRKSNLSAERHHFRSQKFFYGMLGAQLGVIVSTFAMAARKRNWLWSLAAAAGVLALGFAGYVYLFI